MPSPSSTPEPVKSPPQPDATTPAEEWGDRVETGRRIARSGQDSDEVPGATGDDAEDPRAGKKPTEPEQPDAA